MATKKPKPLKRPGINTGKNYQEYLEEAKKKGVNIPDKFYRK